MFSTDGEQDPVVVFKMYREKRPDNMMVDRAPFYLGINVAKKDGSKELVQVGTHGCNQTKHFDENDDFESKHFNV